MRGYSSYFTEVLLKSSSWYYYFIEPTASCPWTAKTLRLSSEVAAETGSGFVELEDSSSPGYAYCNMVAGPSSTWAYAEETTDKKRTFHYNGFDVETIEFPEATSDWQPIKQLGLFGVAGQLSSPIDPTSFIAGCDYDPGIEVLSGTRLVFKLDSIFFILNS